MLLRYGADPNARSDDGRTPILVATAWVGSYEIVKLLLNNGASPSQLVNTYRGPVNPLRLAAEKGDEGVLRLLLARGADAKEQGGVLLLVAATGTQNNFCFDLLLPFADRDATAAEVNATTNNRRPTEVAEVKTTAVEATGRDGAELNPPKIGQPSATRVIGQWPMVTVLPVLGIVLLMQLGSAAEGEPLTRRVAR